MTKPLHAQYVEQQGKPHLVILHGLLGSSDNWRGIATELQQKFSVVCLDLRNHGQSFHADTMTYKEMANDVITTLAILNIKPHTLLGHSMGGKVVMTCLQENPNLCEHAVVVDIAPKAYTHRHTHVLDTINQLHLNHHTTRQSLLNELNKSPCDDGTKQLILKNIGRTNQQEFYWKPNIKALTTAYPLIMDYPAINTPIITPTLFIKGELSDYIQPADITTINTQFVKASHQQVNNAGHWLHVEQPQLFLDMIL